MLSAARAVSKLTRALVVAASRCALEVDADARDENSILFVANFKLSNVPSFVVTVLRDGAGVWWDLLFIIY